MQRPDLRYFGIFVAVLLAVSVACSSTAAPTAVPTATPAPPTVAPTATATPKPTSTPKPTVTPNLAATEQANVRQKLLQTYMEAGYISSTSGKFEKVPDFHEQWAQLGYYSWWPIHSSSVQYGDMLFHGHFRWETAIRTSDLSGCGVLFGLQPNDDHYLVYIDKARIVFRMSRGGNVYNVGKTSGSGRLNLQEPAEADVELIVQGTTAYVLVNGEVTRYTLSMDQTSKGEFAFTLRSGTNKDFGTRCDITDAYIWTPNK